MLDNLILYNFPPLPFSILVSYFEFLLLKDNRIALLETPFSLAKISTSIQVSAVLNLSSRFFILPSITLKLSNWKSVCGKVYQNNTFGVKCKSNKRNLIITFMITFFEITFLLPIKFYKRQGGCFK